MDKTYVDKEYIILIESSNEPCWWCGFVAKDGSFEYGGAYEPSKASEEFVKGVTSYYVDNILKAKKGEI